MKIGIGLKVKRNKPPRIFQVGLKKNKIFIKDVAHIFTKTGEIIKINNDLSIKNYSWGFFIQNKINEKKNYKYILAGSDKKKIHLLSYNPKKKKYFDKYCKIEKLRKIKIKEFYEKQ